MRFIVSLLAIGALLNIFDGGLASPVGTGNQCHQTLLDKKVFKKCQDENAQNEPFSKVSLDSLGNKTLAEYRASTCPELIQMAKCVNKEACNNCEYTDAHLFGDFWFAAQVVFIKDNDCKESPPTKCQEDMTTTPADDNNETGHITDADTSESISTASMIIIIIAVVILLIIGGIVIYCIFFSAQEEPKDTGKSSKASKDQGDSKSKDTPKSKAPVGSTNDNDKVPGSSAPKSRVKSSVSAGGGAGKSKIKSAISASKSKAKSTVVDSKTVLKAGSQVKSKV